MGLDVYLYSQEQHRKDAAYDKHMNEHWEDPDYERWSEEERDRRYEETKRTAPESGGTHEDVASLTNPQHICTRRYLRSSYNAGGFNYAAREFIGEHGSFYWIFEPMGREWDGDEGTLIKEDIPKLQESRKRAQQVGIELAACTPLRTMDASMLLGDAGHLWHELPTEEQVLDWYRGEKALHADEKMFGDGGYSNAKGVVLGFAKGVEVLALTVGQDMLGRPSAIAVYRPDDETLQHYLQTAQIVEEFIDEAIELVERDGSAYLYWSG